MTQMSERRDDAEPFDPSIDLPAAGRSADPQAAAAAAAAPASDEFDSGDFDPPGSDPMSDPMAPPRDPCECYCLHCQRVFMSSDMWFQRVINDPQGFEGFWMCPTPNCSGAGFTFDIFPTDPAHPANEGWHDFDEDGDEFEENDDEFDDSFDDVDGSAAPHLLADDDATADDAAIGEWDPDETKYRELDEEFGDEDDDLEGEEWKFGLQPGERPEPRWSGDEARHEWEEDQARYDAPDERPRVVDWRDRPDRGEPEFNEDDIPF
jgi:hypothetical protein